MFEPKYLITDYFLSAIEQITALQTEFKKNRVRLPSLLKLQKEAFNKNVHSSTLIEGNQLSLNQVSALNDNNEVRADGNQKLEVTNYIQALRWVTNHAAKEINEQDLLRLHKLITQGLIDKNKCGKYRKVRNYVVDGRGIVVYRPPDASKVSELMQELFEWTAREKETNAIIASAIFHHQIVTIHPFTDGNGRIARIASLWLLYQKHYDPLHIIALDKYFADDLQKYYLKIQQARDLDYDFTYWLDYVARGVLETMEDVRRRLYRLAVSPQKDISLSVKQEELINFVRQNAGCGSKSISNSLKINRARVNQLISPLIKAGIIKARGKARATKYFIE
ncbi:MAG: Fic family protein [Actinobacteria bacterium]|nr:MAG: Fic family protein [Actinomycetota bacterium]